MEQKVKGAFLAYNICTRLKSERESRTDGSSRLWSQGVECDRGDVFGGRARTVDYVPIGFLVYCKAPNTYSLYDACYMTNFLLRVAL